MIMAIISLSLVLLTGFAGQVSLAQAAFAGTGGFVLSRLATAAHIPFPFSLLLGALAASAVGVVIAVPALRVRGSQLAVVTLAAAVAVERFVFGNPGITPPLGNPVPDAELFGLDLAVRRGDDLVRFQFGAVRARRAARRSGARRQPDPRQRGPGDARGPLERARRGGGRHRRDVDQAARLRA